MGWVLSGIEGGIGQGLSGIASELETEHSMRLRQKEFNQRMKLLQSAQQYKDSPASLANKLTAAHIALYTAQAHAAAKKSAAAVMGALPVITGKSTVPQMAAAIHLGIVHPSSPQGAALPINKALYAKKLGAPYFDYTVAPTPSGQLLPFKLPLSAGSYAHPHAAALAPALGLGQVADLSALQGLHTTSAAAPHMYVPKFSGIPSPVAPSSVLASVPTTPGALDTQIHQEKAAIHKNLLSQLHETTTLAAPIPGSQAYYSDYPNQWTTVLGGQARHSTLGNEEANFHTGMVFRSMPKGLIDKLGGYITGENRANAALDLVKQQYLKIPTGGAGQAKIAGHRLLNWLNIQANPGAAEIKAKANALTLLSAEGVLRGTGVNPTDQNIKAALGVIKYKPNLSKIGNIDVINGIQGLLSKDNVINRSALGTGIIVQHSYWGPAYHNLSRTQQVLVTMQIHGATLAAPPGTVPKGWNAQDWINTHIHGQPHLQAQQAARQKLIEEAAGVTPSASPVKTLPIQQISPSVPKPTVNLAPIIDPFG